MKRRAYLRTVTLAVPGLLLTGWAPARAVARPLHLSIHYTGDGERSQALLDGIEFGLDEVNHSARLLQVPLVVHRAAAVAGHVGSISGMGVQVVVATADDSQHVEGTTGPRIYTCPLREWRPNAWSVASPDAVRWPQGNDLDWHASLDTPAAAQLNARFVRRTRVPMDEAAWRGWMAVKVAFEVALRAEAGEDDLLALRFDGHKGQPLRFAEGGHLVQPTCRLVGGHAALVPPVDRDVMLDGE